MESEYITKSTDYATNAQQEYENSLSYLLTGLDESKALDQQAAQVRYQNLVAQIEQQIPGIQQRFERNARAAYINKQQNLQQIDNDLLALGVNTQGFGVTQRLLNNVAYGQQYGDLVLNYNEDLRNIENQKVNALGDLNEDLADLDAAYAKDKLETQKYIGEQGRDVYNTTYNNYYNDLQYQDRLKQQDLENERAEQDRADKLKQQEWENAFKEKQYQDQLKQQKFENDLATKQYKLQYYVAHKKSSGGGGGRSSVPKKQAKNNEKLLTSSFSSLERMFSNSSAYIAQQALLEVEQANGGVTESQIKAVLNNSDYKFSNADKTRIKKMYGLS
jgi:hypothetical protein